jgi:hypothetical protein
MLRPRSWLLRFAAPLFALATAQAQTTLFADDFEGGAANWTVEGFWHLADEGPPCLDSSFPSGSHCMWYGSQAACNYDMTPIEFQRLRIASTIQVPIAGITSIEFWSRSEVENDTTWDTRTVEVSTNSGTDWTPMFQVVPMTEPWTFHQVDLSAFAGQTIDVSFTFWAGDSLANWFLGWLVDDVAIRTVPEVYPMNCFGDGSGAACPCSNSGAAGRGCQNSASTGGAFLTVTGTANPDTIVLNSSGENPNALTIFLQGSANIGPVSFGDGLRCAGGTLRRLYVNNASGGIAFAPLPGDPSVSARATALGDLIHPGSRRYYQTYYRDPSASFCPAPQGANFNASQMRRITW